MADSATVVVSVVVTYLLLALAPRVAVALEFRVDRRGWARRGKRRLDRLGAFLRIHDRDRGHVDDVLHVRAALEHVHGPAHADKNRADDRGAAKVMQQLVGDVARTEVRKDQDVRLLLERRERI